MYVAYDFKFGICPSWPLPSWQESMFWMEVPMDHDHYGLLILKYNPALYYNIIICNITLSIYSTVVKNPQVAVHLAILIMEHTRGMQLELHDTVNIQYFNLNDRMIIMKMMMNVCRAVAYHRFKTMLGT